MAPCCHSTEFVTANVALHTDDVLRLGGFDESLTLYGGEDTEFGYRLSRLGLPIILNCAAAAATVEDKTLDIALRQFRLLGQTNLRTLYAKHPEMPKFLGTEVASSRRLRDRLMTRVLDPRVAQLVRWLVDRVPFSLAAHLIRYEIASAVLKGYRWGGRQ